MSWRPAIMSLFSTCCSFDAQSPIRFFSCPLAQESSTLTLLIHLWLRLLTHFLPFPI